MEEKNAWEAMFSLVPPRGVDLDKAEVALMGKGEVDPSIKLKPKIQQRTDEFLMDPAGFLSANASDPRVPRWTRLATGLGVSVAGTSPAEAAPPLKRILSASALMSASVGDGTPTIPVFESGKARGLSPGAGDRHKRDRDMKDARNLPPIGMMVIQSPKYIDLRDRLMEAVQRERYGMDGAQDEVREIGKEITRLACSHNRLEELAGGMLQRLRRSLAAWEDVHDPKTFQANYITGIYAD